MSSQAITQLRKDGKLQEAYDLAITEIQEAIDNQQDPQFLQQALGWVIYALIKEAVTDNHFDQVLQLIGCLNDNQCHEPMIADALIFQLRKLLAHNKTTLKTDDLDALFHLIKPLPFNPAGEHYSVLIESFLSIKCDWPHFLEFVEWYGWNHFQPNDYQPHEYNGKAYPSVVERVYNRYSKTLIERCEGQQLSTEAITFLRTYVERLSNIIKQHPDYLWLPYMQAKITLLYGDKKQAYDLLVNFTRTKNEFWVWDLLAQTIDDPMLQLACYCKSLHRSRVPQEYLISVRKDLAYLLIQLERYPEAKTELQIITNTRTKAGWRPDPDITAISKQPWHQSTTALKNNHTLYAEHQQQANQIIFSNLPLQTIVINGINTPKQIINFAYGNQQFGFANYKSLIAQPTLGQLYHVRMTQKSQGAYFTLHTATPISDCDNNTIIKNQSGPLRLHPQGFGFVNDIFIPPTLIKNSHLDNGTKCQVSAVITFNRKKNKAGWSAYAINPCE